MTYKVVRGGLLAGVSALALVAGLFSTPAQAFDTVNWRWDAYVKEYVHKYVDIDVYLDPTGMVMLEDLQVFIGDVNAESYVYDIDNDQPGGHYKYVDLRKWGKYGWGKKVDATPDAVDHLPEVISAATAVANNTSIETDASVELHEGQFAVGDPERFALVSAALNGNSNGGGYGGNTNLELAGALTIGALFGLIDPSEIHAKSKVWDIKNATVDSSATAVANNLTVDVEAKYDDRLVIGDVVQFAVANVSAKSELYDVYIDGYKNLGRLDRPIVNSIATAVGNNKSITVKAPVVNAGN